MIGIVDLGIGNRASVVNAFAKLSADAVLTADHERLRACERLVLNGVGAFPAAMRAMRDAGLDVLVRERARAGVPVIGLCLGMQLLFDRSTEHEGADGLGLIPGEVRPLDARGEKVPHIGWSTVRWTRPGTPLVEGLGDEAAFYHVHSFVPQPAERDVPLGWSTHGSDFVSVVERGNVCGAQFHPEKSSRDGLRLLGNWARQPTPGRVPALVPA